MSSARLIWCAGDGDRPRAALHPCVCVLPNEQSAPPRPFAYQSRALITFLLLAFAAASSPTKKLQEKSIAKRNELKLNTPE